MSPHIGLALTTALVLLACAQPATAEATDVVDYVVDVGVTLTFDGKPVFYFHQDENGTIIGYCPIEFVGGPPGVKVPDTDDGVYVYIPAAWPGSAYPILGLPVSSGNLEGGYTSRC